MVSVPRTALLFLVLAPLAVAAEPPAGEPGGPGLCLLARKVITAAGGDGWVDNAALLVRDGRVEEVRPQRGLEVPEGYQVVDLGERWIAPGLIDLHCHVAMSLQDLSDSAYLTNPGMRSAVGITPANENLLNGMAGGVCSVLYIPGSATNMGGQGVLLRTGLAHYEEALLRDPGSLKLAQAGNPERLPPWYPQRSFMNWNTRNTFRRGMAYAARWEAYEKGEGPKPERDLQFDIFRELKKGTTQVSVHTQIYQVVLATLEQVVEGFGVPLYIDHGTFDGWRAAPLAEKLDVPAILGPRQITVGVHAPGFAEYDQDGAIYGVAAKYQEEGHTRVGFNTDCVGPPSASGPGQEELGLQAAMGVRYGFHNEDMQAVRGVTSVPAEAAGLADRLGTLEPGKDADLIVVTGDPNDPRTSVEAVYQAGRKVYDTSIDHRRF